jgi:hypothetical protein
MKFVAGENDAAGQFQRLTASEFLPQLSQDEFLMGGWYGDQPLEDDGSGNSNGGGVAAPFFSSKAISPLRQI